MKVFAYMSQDVKTYGLNYNSRDIKEKYVIAVIYRHPHNNFISFNDMLDEKSNVRNKKQKVFTSGE